MKKIHSVVTLRKYVDNWKNGEEDSQYDIVSDEMFDTVQEAIESFKDSYAKNQNICQDDGKLYVTVQIPKTEDQDIFKLPTEDIITLWMKGKFDMFCLEYELALSELAEQKLYIPKDYETAAPDEKMTQQN